MNIHAWVRSEMDRIWRENSVEVCEEAMEQWPRYNDGGRHTDNAVEMAQESLTDLLQKRYMRRFKEEMPEEELDWASGEFIEKLYDAFT